MQVQLEQIYRFLCAIAGGVASYLWGGWSLALETLLVFVVIDYATGVIAGARHGELSSKKGFKGILFKVSIFAVVAVAHKVDQMLGDGHFFRDSTITFYILNEALSIIENVGKIGVPIPDEVKRAIEVLRGKQKEKENKEEGK